MSEFNLSESRERFADWLYSYKSKLGQGIINDILQRIKDQDKEFIKRLKEEFIEDYAYDSDHINEEIDKRAGESLVWPTIQKYKPLKL